MTAAAQRAAFAAVGRDLLAARGSAGERRASALVGSATLPVRFDALSAVPAWLRWPAGRQAALARAVAVRALAPALANSIDGAWLGGIAAVAGEGVLDWAIAAGGGEDMSHTPIIAPAELESTGRAALRETLPATLRDYIPAGNGDVRLTLNDTIVSQSFRFVEGDGE